MNRFIPIVSRYICTGALRLPDLILMYVYSYKSFKYYYTYIVWPYKCVCLYECLLLYKYRDVHLDTFRKILLPLFVTKSNPLCRAMYLRFLLCYRFYYVCWRFCIESIWSEKKHFFEISIWKCRSLSKVSRKKKGRTRTRATPNSRLLTISVEIKNYKSRKSDFLPLSFNSVGIKKRSFLLVGNTVFKSQIECL
jgi:hypothetical protein